MSDQSPLPRPVGMLPHVMSSQYVDLRPNGYLFAIIDQFVRIVYYHDEPRIVMEMMNENLESKYQVVPTRVQDVSITISVEDFVKLAAKNLRDVQKSHPDILTSNGIHLEDSGV